MKKFRILFYIAAILFIALGVFFSVFYIREKQKMASLTSCESRSNLPARFSQFSLEVRDRDGRPLAGKRVNFIQTTNDFLLGTLDGKENYDRLFGSNTFECWQFTTMSYRERTRMSEKDMEQLCRIKDLAKTIKRLPRAKLRLEPARILDSTFMSTANVEPGENQDSNMNLKKPKVIFTEFADQDLASQEKMLALMKKEGVEPYMLQLCGEWNARELNSMKGLDRRQISEHCDKIVRMARKYYPDTLIALDLLPLYEFKDKGLCKPACEHLDPLYFHKENGLNHHQITDEQFLDDLERLGTPYDIISVEYQMGMEHAGDADDLIFLTERFKKYGKKIYNWDLTFLSQKSDLEWKEGFEKKDYDPYAGKNNREDLLSEAWQKEQYKKYFDYILADDRNIGLMMFRITDPRKEHQPEMTRYAYPGFIRKDGTKKPSHDALMDFVNSLNTRCYAMTDDSGTAKFAANPGVYNAHIDGQKQRVTFSEKNEKAIFDYKR